MPEVHRIDPKEKAHLNRLDTPGWTHGMTLETAVHCCAALRN
jgi:hypothetical protein